MDHNQSLKTINYERFPEYQMQSHNFPVIQKGVKEHTRPKQHKGKEQNLLQISDYYAKNGFNNRDSYIQKTGYNNKEAILNNYSNGNIK